MLVKRPFSFPLALHKIRVTRERVFDIVGVDEMDFNVMLKDFHYREEVIKTVSDIPLLSIKASFSNSQSGPNIALRYFLHGRRCAPATLDVIITGTPIEHGHGVKRIRILEPLAQ